jgi:hypothetical protein
VTFPNVQDVEALSREDAAEALRQVAALQVALVLRVTTPTPAPAPTPVESDDVTSDVAEAAKIAHRSVSWVRKHGAKKLPGFRQPGGPGTRVGWSRRALEAWARGAA